MRLKNELIPLDQQAWPLPANDPWSTPFARMLLYHLELFSGASVLDIASGHGVPAFHIAEQVGPGGRVLGVDLHPGQILRCRSAQGGHLPWLQFAQGDMRALPADLGKFDRITGNIAFMFFRPNRLDALKQLVRFLNPGGQIVLTFPSLGTFDSIWNRVDREMAACGLKQERDRLAEYIAERPSAGEVREWLEALQMERIEVVEWPLEIKSGLRHHPRGWEELADAHSREGEIADDGQNPASVGRLSARGQAFLNHPLLRGGFLDDAYECFEDPALANRVMDAVADDLMSFTPLLAIRCAFSAWRPLE